MGLIKGKKRNDAAARRVVRLVMVETKGKGPVFEWFVALLAAASPK